MQMQMEISIKRFFIEPGLLLVPNGEDIGYALGDFNPYESNVTLKKAPQVAHRTTASESESINVAKTSHPWGIFITIIGTVLLDFDADACQSPSRAYLLDVTVPADHAKGLSTFTIMAGLGGFMGYSLGAINWEETSFGKFMSLLKKIKAKTVALACICLDGKWEFRHFSKRLFRFG